MKGAGPGRPTRRVRALALAALLALGAGGCGGRQALADSRDVVARWLEAVGRGDAEAALALYVEPVARGEAAEAMRARLAALARHGPPAATEELAWQVHARVRDEGTGWFVTLAERVTWRGCALTLRFHLHRPFGGGEARILGHERRDEEGCDDGVAV